VGARLELPGIAQSPTRCTRRRRRRSRSRWLARATSPGGCFRLPIPPRSGRSSELWEDIPGSRRRGGAPAVTMARGRVRPAAEVEAMGGHGGAVVVVGGREASIAAGAGPQGASSAVERGEERAGKVRVCLVGFSRQPGCVSQDHWSLALEIRPICSYLVSLAQGALRIVRV
jgi:hypothetical protein